MNSIDSKYKAGFTIVELLIVIVVIAILAAISIVAYSGIQQRGRDSQRKSDIATIVKSLEMYYIDNGKYPPGSCTSGASCTIGSSWSTTADDSWPNLATHLVPKYISSLPADPVSKPGASPLLSTGNYNYAYFSDRNGTYCGPAGQTYILVYNMEGEGKKDVYVGNCDTINYSALGPYNGSNYRVVKN